MDEIILKKYLELFIVTIGIYLLILEIQILFKY